MVMLYAIGGVFIFRLLLSMAVLCIIIVAGCAGNHDQITHENHYDEDGYMGMTNANPSLVVTPNSNNYGSDIEMIKHTLREIRGIRKSTIIVDGATAFLHIKLDRAFSDVEVRQIRDETEQRVALMVPRYEIRVTVYQ